MIAGRQLTLLSLPVPFWVVYVMDGMRGVKETIAVACAAAGQVGKEADLFRFTVKHSLLCAVIVDVITLVQADGLSGTVPNQAPAAHPTAQPLRAWRTVAACETFASSSSSWRCGCASPARIG